MFTLENSRARIEYNPSKDLFPEVFTLTREPQVDDISPAPQSTTFTYLSDIPGVSLNSKSISNGSNSGVRQASVSQDDLYEYNGGTSLVITAHNKIIIASDTRHSSEYTINSRRMTKIFKVAGFYLSTTGFYADSFEVYTILCYEVQKYETYGKITLKALAHLLHNVLYSRRFFPYYTYCILSGMESGVATMYSYDPVGSYQLSQCRCNGSGATMIQPLLDSWIGGGNFKGFRELTFPETVELVKKAFDAACERDVKTKDYLEMYVVDEEGETHEFVDLRRD